MKGALWTVSSNLFGGYAVSGKHLCFRLLYFLHPSAEPKLALKLAKSLFSCQANENVCPSTFGIFNLTLPTSPTAFHSKSPFYPLRRLFVSFGDPSESAHTDFIQDLDNLTEPCFLVYDVPTPSLEKALSHLRLSLKVDSKEDSLVLRCREKRLERVRTMNEVIKNCVSQRSETLINT